MIGVEKAIPSQVIESKADDQAANKKIKKPASRLSDNTGETFDFGKENLKEKPTKNCVIF